MAGNTEEHHEKFVLTDEAADYILSILGPEKDKNTHFVGIWSNKLKKTFSVNKLRDRNFLKFATGQFWKEDLYFSMSTFMPSTQVTEYEAERENDNGEIERAIIREIHHFSPKTENIFNKYAWGIDIDYKKATEKGSIMDTLDPRSMFDLIVDTVGEAIPMPNYIEYSHQLRLIYILDQPVFASIPSGKPMMKAIKKIEKHFCDIINNELHCGCEPQKEFIRIPGSVNSKDGSIVHVDKISDVRYTVQELLTEYMPALPVFKKKEKKTELTPEELKQKRQHAHNNILLAMENRIHDFEIMRKFEGIQRELLLFAYISSWQKLHYDATYAQFQEALYTFNAGFEDPLEKKEIDSKFKSNYHKIYKFTNATLMDTFNLTDEICKQEGLILRRDANKARDQRRRQKLIVAGKTRAQMTEKRTEQVRKWYLMGFSAEQIAKELKFTIDTVRGAIARIRGGMTKEERSAVHALQTKNRKAGFTLDDQIKKEKKAAKAEEKRIKEEKKAAKKAAKEEKESISEYNRRSREEYALFKPLVNLTGNTEWSIEMVRSFPDEVKKFMEKWGFIEKKEKDIRRSAKWKEKVKNRWRRVAGKDRDRSQTLPVIVMQCG